MAAPASFNVCVSRGVCCVANRRTQYLILDTRTGHQTIPHSILGILWDVGPNLQHCACVFESFRTSLTLLELRFSQRWLAPSCIMLSWLAHSSTLKMEAVYFSVTSVYFQLIKGRRSPQDTSCIGLTSQFPDAVPLPL
jgi:hypothetical protein